MLYMVRSGKNMPDTIKPTKAEKAIERARKVDERNVAFTQAWPVDTRVWFLASVLYDPYNGDCDSETGHLLEGIVVDHYLPVRLKDDPSVTVEYAKESYSNETDTELTGIYNRHVATNTYDTRTLDKFIHEWRYSIQSIQPIHYGLPQLWCDYDAARAVSKVLLSDHIENCEADLAGARELWAERGFDAS